MKAPQVQDIAAGAIQRYESLDCLRGIAASIVLFAHTLVFMTGPSMWFKLADGKIWVHPILDLYPTRILFSGHQAVILFFVLSGFALYMMFHSTKSKVSNRSAVLVYLLSRWLRLYPVYIFSLAVAISALLALNALPLRYPDSPWLPSATIDAWNIIGHLTLVGLFDSSRFNSPIWSIIYEMRISILFPVIYLIVCRLDVYAIIVALLASLAVTVALSFPVLSSNVYLRESALTIHYAGLFMVGAVIAHCRDGVIQWVLGLSATRVMMIIIIGLALYTYGLIHSQPLFVICLTDLVAGAGSVILIALCLSYPLLQKSRTLRWLGRSSYSLYLMHFPCLVVIYKIFSNVLPFYILVVMMVASSLAVSGLAWLIVESRSLSWSRRVRRISVHSPLVTKTV